MSGKTVIGIERDRAILRGCALKIIRTILEKPMLSTKVDVRGDWLAPPPLETFRRLEPLGFGLDQKDWWVFRAEDCPPDLVWPLSVGTVNDRSGEEGHLSLAQTNTVSARQARGYASRFGPFMVRHDVAQMDKGKMLRAACLYVWCGGAWVNAQKRTLWSSTKVETAIPEKEGAISAQDRLQPALMTAVALKQRYEWSVSLGLEKSPSIRFATDPTGIKEVFAIRDLPEGRDRREALLTWVSDHWRQDRTDPDIELYVRKHLRGATSFTWRAMNCELLPAQYDVEQRDRLVSDRAAMRAAGADRRAKVAQ